MVPHWTGWCYLSWVTRELYTFQYFSLTNSRSPVKNVKNKTIQLSQSMYHRFLDSEGCAEGGTHSVAVPINNPLAATNKSLLQVSKWQELLFSSYLHYLSASCQTLLFYSGLSVLPMRENHLKYARKAYPKCPAGGVKGIWCLSIKSITL